MIKKSKLSVSVHDVEFAKDFQYFISVHYEGSKKQTDVSALARNPIFTNNTFFFDLPSNHTLRGAIIFIAHMALEEEEPMHSKKQNAKKAKILGECSLDITPFGLQPTQTYNLPIRQQMKFFRIKDGKQISVGRFIASFKIVPEEDVPVYLQEVQEKKLEKNQIFMDLPDYDEELNFSWRVKIDIREALNIPSIENVVPQVYVEAGWTQYKDTLPEEKRIFSTAILNSNHPQWNQIFLITNPSHITSAKGFIMIALKQKNALEDLSRIYIPIASMGSFIPYNIKVKESKDLSTNTQLYISFILENASSQKQRLHDIIVADVLFQPLIAPYKQMNLALVIDSQDQPNLNFVQFKPAEDSIERVLEFELAPQFTYILTQTMKLPPIKSAKQFRAACIFTIPQSFFKKNLNIYVIGKKQKGKYGLMGMVESIQRDLVNMVIEKTKKRLFFNVRSHPNVKMGKCQIQIADKDQSKVISQSRVSSRQGEQTASEKLMKDLNISSNDSLFKHITQNNDIIARILRELDDKSESLRQAGSQISDLRSRIKLLQNQNSILRRKALHEEDELVNMVHRQIDGMSQRQLKDKIVKISQLYKGERIQNKELQKAIKVMEPQVSNVMQLNSVILNQKNNIQVLEEKITKFKKDNERINIYKDTIKKQEKVIVKLQKVMKDGTQEVRNARQLRIQLQELKKKGSHHFHGNNSSQRQQIERLQKIIAELQQKNSKNMNLSNVSDGNSFELQFKLHQAQTRIESLEGELQEKSKQYARQIAMYKLKIAQKQAILDGFSNTHSYN